MAKILVVDDSAVDRHLAGNLLAKSLGFSAPEIATGMAVAYAAGGREALHAIEQDPPDLVLTDLQMPEMSGLELVEEVRRRFPLVPVILMTAHGSEEIALAALGRGAASYVPKRRLAQDLLETVETVLALAAAERGHRRLQECLVRSEAHFLLGNDPGLIPPLLGHVRDNLTRMDFCDETGIIRVTMALHEALTHAIFQGNLEINPELREHDEGAYRRLVEERRWQPPYRDRQVQVIARELPSEVRYVVRDEGPGFDFSRTPDPTDPTDLETVTDRGVLLIWTFMDQVSNNERGDEITMVKKRERPAAR
jgi:CheY-like chemotaxis protein